MKQYHLHPPAPVPAGEIFAVVAMAAVLILGTACDLLSSTLTGEEQVTVHLPPLPAAAGFSGMKEPVWTVSWYDADLQRQERTVQGNRCVLTMKKGMCTPVVAEARSPDPRFGPFPPAGSIYPALATASRDATTLRATWHGGIAAKTAQLAFGAADGGPATARIILSRFNWHRLLQELEKLEYPEYTDYNRLVTALLSGRVRVHDIRMLPRAAVRLELPAGRVSPGSVFFPVWPGRTAFVWNETNSLSLELPRIMTRFYSQEGCITVFPARPSTERTIFLPYSLQE